MISFKKYFVQDTKVRWKEKKKKKKEKGFVVFDQ